MGVFYVGDFIPWLSWLDPNRYLKRMKASGRQARVLLQEVIDKRRRQKRDSRAVLQAEQDFLDVLLAAFDQHTISDDNVIYIYTSISDFYLSILYIKETGFQCHVSQFPLSGYSEDSAHVGGGERERERKRERERRPKAAGHTSIYTSRQGFRQATWCKGRPIVHHTNCREWP
ncbi:hypothetical protein GOP47_0007930 [Adiantum capillus-veneris]|uniref:Uncharacterized protein n=1 Tax=Adiantum capillus-veneris TaxID=13818 RepID=A0A9D4V1N1_ADICA|nr:hypothetical protein GOP47_0007930 [Adiantum capillus-veneris]